MKESMKDLVRSTLISIGISMVIFCLAGIVFDLKYDGNFSLENYGFTKMVVGCVMIGLGFGIPTIVYRKENLPTPIKVIIHMGIGCAVYTIVAFAVGWIGSSASVGKGIAVAAIQLGIAFMIWFFFMRYYRKEAQRMNERIKTLK